jgi:hypothetical protein
MNYLQQLFLRMGSGDVKPGTPLVLLKNNRLMLALGFSIFSHLTYTLHHNTKLTLILNIKEKPEKIK